MAAIDNFYQALADLLSGKVVFTAGFGPAGAFPAPAPSPSPSPTPTTTPVTPLSSWKPQSLAGIQFFLPTDPINTDISASPVHAQSAAWVSLVSTLKLHPLWDAIGDGQAYQVFTGSEKPTTFTFTVSDESDAGPYPLPASLVMEGVITAADAASMPSGDHHWCGVDPVGKKLYELYQPRLDNGIWKAYSGAIFDLTKGLPQRPAGWTSTDAAGLPVLPLCAKKAEVDAAIADGSKCLKHAIRFTAPSATTGHAYMAPATHYASANPNGIPFGARFRLKASVDVSAFGPQCQVILNTLKKYGAILADNGGSALYLDGVYDPTWNDDDCHGMTNILGSSLEFVDTGAAIVTT